MRVPDFLEFLQSVDMDEVRELMADENPGVQSFQFSLTDSAAVSNFVNLLRGEILNSNQRLILAYLTLYHRWLQDAISDD